MNKITKEGKLKRNQKEIHKCSNLYCEMKNSVEEFSCRFERAEERIGKLEDREMEISKCDKWKGKR